MSPIYSALEATARREEADLRTCGKMIGIGKAPGGAPTVTYHARVYCTHALLGAHHL